MIAQLRGTLGDKRPNQVLVDVVKACDPVWAVVRGEFRPRGGIGTTVEAKWPRPTKGSESAR